MKEDQLAKLQAEHDEESLELAALQEDEELSLRCSPSLPLPPSLAPSLSLLLMLSVCLSVPQADGGRSAGPESHPDLKCVVWLPEHRACPPHSITQSPQPATHSYSHS